MADHLRVNSLLSRNDGLKRGAAHAALAMPHADSGQSLQFVQVVGAAPDRLFDFPQGDVLAPANGGIAPSQLVQARTGQ